jgi:hypothetical protein
MGLRKQRRRPAENNSTGLKISRAAASDPLAYFVAFLIETIFLRVPSWFQESKYGKTRKFAFVKS